MDCYLCVVTGLDLGLLLTHPGMAPEAAVARLQAGLRTRYVKLPPALDHANALCLM